MLREQSPAHSSKLEEGQVHHKWNEDEADANRAKNDICLMVMTAIILWIEVGVFFLKILLRIVVKDRDAGLSIWVILVSVDIIDQGIDGKSKAQDSQQDCTDQK